MTMDNGMDVSPSWEELREERDALAEERQGLRKVIATLGAENREIRMEAEALAAHVGRLVPLIEACMESDSDFLPDWDVEARQVLSDTPETSLARLKAEWQAKALEVFASSLYAEYGKDETANIYAMARLLETRAAQLRRQASEPTHD